MNFSQYSPIVYPFTAHYFGFLADLGQNPVFNLNLFSVSTNELIPVRFYLDINEMVQVGDNVLIVGRVYLNKIENTLAAGDYRMDLSVQSPTGSVSLMYFPISITAAAEPVSTLVPRNAEANPEVLIDYVSSVVDPGIKKVFRFRRGSFELSFDVLAGGSLYTDDGTLIELHKDYQDCFKIDPTGLNGRTDAVCIYYDKTETDALYGVREPRFIVVKGIEDAQGTQPSIPPRYNVIGYAYVEPNATLTSQVRFAEFNPLGLYRPISNVQSVNVGDGVRTIFEFPARYKEMSSSVTCGGVHQNIGADYIEHPNYNGRGAIEFVGEAPYPGARVAISYSEYLGQFYDHTYTLPNPDIPHVAIVPAYTRDSLVGEYIAGNIYPSVYPDSSGAASSFKQTITYNCPLKGWDISGDYLSFNGSQWMTMETPIQFNGDFTVALIYDHRSTPHTGSWMRILTKLDDSNNPAFYLMHIDTQDGPAIRVCAGTMGNYVEITASELAANGHMLWDDVPLKIIVSYTGGTLSLNIKGYAKSAATPHGTYSVSKTWYLGGAEDVGAGARLYGRIKLILMWDRALSTQEQATLLSQI